MTKYPTKCKTCGRQLYRATRSTQFVCSKCFKGKGYIQKFHNAKKSIVKKAGKCSLCGSVVRLQVHHIDGNKKNNKESNFRVLCVHCHISVEGNKGKKLKGYYKGKFGTRLQWEDEKEGKWERFKKFLNKVWTRIK